jgi:guanylate kinase
MSIEFHDKHSSVLFAFSSPSGAGKTAMTRALCDRDPALRMSVSVTTRLPRPQEQEGIDYFFTTHEDFEQRKRAEEFAEHASVFSHWYGTLKSHIHSHSRQGRDVIFDIDWQGARQLKTQYPHHLVSIFILPPSLAELEARLHKRAQDHKDVIAYRMKQATEEISHWSEYDYVVVNDDFEKALSTIETIIRAERVKHRHSPSFHSFVQKMLGDKGGEVI